MKKGDIINQALADPEAHKLPKLKDKFILMMACAYQECEEDFSRLDGLTWPMGDGVLISKSKQQIENSFESAKAEQIANSPFYAEIGQDKTALKRIIEMAFERLGYPAGLRNKARNFIEPPPKIDLVALYRQKNEGKRTSPDS